VEWHKRAADLKDLYPEKGYYEIADIIGKEYGHVPSYEAVKKAILRDKWGGREKKGREESRPIIKDLGEYYLVTSKRREIQVTKDKLKQIKDLYCTQGITMNHVCYKLNIPRRDFYIIKTAFNITHDDVPFIDEEIQNRPVDDLVNETLEKRKEQYFVKLQQEEIKQLKKEVEIYRKKDYELNRIHELVTEHYAKTDIGSKNVIIPKTNSGLMLEVPIVDLHLGKLSWQPETGENYDCNIAEERFMSVVYDIVDSTKDKKFEKILFIIGNDFFNFDNIDGTTTKGTLQQNDGRWQKMYLKGNDLLTEAISLFSKIASVDVLEIPGNHDEMTMYYTIVNLASWFRNNGNVSVDISPRKRKYREFGKCLIGFTHMDKERKRIEGNMQVEAPEAWGRTLYREWHGGHLHSEQTKEVNGIKIRNLSSVTGTDAWHYDSGYVGSVATSQTFIWDKEKGLKNILYSTI